MKKILVVDDINANRKLLSKILSKVNDYNVIEAANGYEAITLVEKEDPDIILMDVNMPEMNGYQSASAIKENTGDNHIPIIFVTALSEEASLSHALTSGGDDFIGKPLNADILKSKINAHLRIRELNQQLNEKNVQLKLHNQNLINEQELIEHFFKSTLQRSFTNKESIKYHMSSMSTFNGDIFLVEQPPQGGIYLVMGDFTGHGLTAAMGTLPVAMIFFKMAKLGFAIGDIAREINYQLNKLMPTGMFFAATLIELNIHNDYMSVWMGGVPEIYWFGKNSELKDVIHARHMPLGILNDSSFNAAVDTYNVEKDDKVYLYSDGVTEASNSDGEMFGDDRLKEILTTQGDNRFDEVLKNLNTFTNTNDQNDDITLVEITCSEVLAVTEDKQNVCNTVNTLPWHLSISLSEKEMRNQKLVNELSEILSSIPALEKHKGILHILLSEMYINALDHSILELESSTKENTDQFSDYYKLRTSKLKTLKNASIVFDFSVFEESNQQYLKIRMKDSGKGYKKHVASNSSDEFHGRGIQIINGLCESTSFTDDGKTFEALYRL